METIDNWRGEPVEVARSAGGVLAAVDPWANVVRGGVEPWPPPELLQKVYKSRQVRAFRGSGLVRVTSSLGYYSDLQSLNSEDAITWSVFGPIVYASPELRRRYVSTLLDLIQIDGDRSGSANVWLWRRIPHPETQVSGGPEVDFGLQLGSVFLIGEAKWGSKVGEKQGVAGDKTQIDLRVEFCRKILGPFVTSRSNLVVLAVSETGSILSPSDEPCGEALLHQREMTWDQLCSIEAHPDSSELRSYLSWKRRHSGRAVRLNLPDASVPPSVPDPL